MWLYPVLACPVNSLASTWRSLEYIVIKPYVYKGGMKFKVWSGIRLWVKSWLKTVVLKKYPTIYFSPFLHSFFYQHQFWRCFGWESRVFNSWWKNSGSPQAVAMVFMNKGSVFREVSLCFQADVQVCPGHEGQVRLDGWSWRNCRLLFRWNKRFKGLCRNSEPDLSWQPGNKELDGYIYLGFFFFFWNKIQYYYFLLRGRTIGRGDCFGLIFLIYKGLSWPM